MISKQKLTIEIDGWHEYFHGRHTPAIVDLIRRVADNLDRAGVQMIKYPFGLYDDDGKPIIEVNLDESLQTEDDDNA